MGTVDVLTKTRMLAIEAASVVGGLVNGSGHLILTKFDASTIDAGSVIGPQGNPGTNGTNGTAPGIPWTYDASTTIADPGNGKFRVNAAFTHIAIDPIDLNGADKSAWLAGLLGSTLMFQHDTGGGASYAVTAVTAASGYYDLTVVLKATWGTVTNTLMRVMAIPADQPLLAWPVGSIFMAVVATNPATLLGGGTWVRWGQGRFPVSLDSAQTEFDVVEETGGEKTHTLTQAEVPNTQLVSTDGFSIQTGAGAGGAAYLVSGSGTSNGNIVKSGGGNGAHNNLPPYITCYMWKRTA